MKLRPATNSRVPLPLPSKYWDYRHKLAWLVLGIALICISLMAKMFGYFSCVHWLICTSSGENGSARFHMCWLGYLFLWFGLAFLVLHLFWTFVFKPFFLRIISQHRALRVSDFIFMGGIFSQVFQRTAEIRCICTYKVYSSPFRSILSPYSPTSFIGTPSSSQDYQERMWTSPCWELWRDRPLLELTS